MTAILSDAAALEQINPKSRDLYKKYFDRLRSFLDRDLEDNAPTEMELISYLKHVRNDLNAASSTMWTTYSMLNSMCKAKYNIDLKKFSRVSFYITVK